MPKQAPVFAARHRSSTSKSPELMGQAGALIAGQAAHEISEGIAAGQAAGVFSADAADCLTRAYDTCWRLQCAGRLLSANPLDADSLGQASAAFLARSLGFETLEDLQEAVLKAYAGAAACISAALPEEPAP